MRTAERTLEALGEVSRKHPDYVFRRVYRELFNRDLFLRAYLKLAPNEGNMTRGVDGQTIDGFSMDLVDGIIDELRHERYHPKPVRREYIPKANGKMRPLGIPTFRDKLVQEALRELLEAIYEPVFSDCSHGFRPGRGCHTALKSIQFGCRGTTWVIEGDITSFFDNIDHDTLLRLIAKKVDDGRVLELIRRFLKAGYMEDGSFRETELGSPQGGVLSPLLANIYLHELDVFVEGLKEEYERGVCRGTNPDYSTLRERARRAEARGDRRTADMARRAMRTVPSSDPMDSGFVRIQYCRYADDWCIFIIGSKALAVEIMGRIACFLDSELRLELSESKTRITNLADGNVRFLGYEIAKIRNDDRLTEYGDGSRRRCANGCITLLMPRDAVNRRVAPITVGGKPAPRDEMLGWPVEGIVWKYVSEINGVYNYYCLASNVAHRMNEYKRIHYLSLLRTIAKKERSSVRKVLRKYGREVPRADGRGTHIVLCIERDGEAVAWYPYEGFRKRAFAPKPRSEGVQEFGKELKKRILNDRCEVCSGQGNVEVHHVRNLKQTVERYEMSKKGVPDWVALMRDMGRKTLVLCDGCHRKLHSGKLIIPSVHRRARCAERRTSGSDRGEGDTPRLLYSAPTGRPRRSSPPSGAWTT